MSCQFGETGHAEKEDRDTAAIAHAGTTARFGFAVNIFGRLIAKASCAGRTATHSRQPVHSTERICASSSTGSAEGHALAHFAQSMRVSVFLRIRAGLSQEVRPSSAPYAQRKRHQKF